MDSAQTMDVRKRAEPLLPENLVGNVVTFVFAETNIDREVVPELKDLVAELRRGIKEFTENKAKRLRGDDASQLIFEDLVEFGMLMGRKDTHGLVLSSMCNFQLYEAANFGWGEPIWLTVPSATRGHGDFVRLMDTREGGVEAFVILSKEDMDLFERDTELLEFAYIYQH